MNTSLDNVFVRQIYKSLKYTYCSLSNLKSKKDVSSNPVHGEVYSIQHYVIKFVSDLRQVGGFLLLYILSRISINSLRGAALEGD
jgi:hypothetical protein